MRQSEGEPHPQGPPHVPDGPVQSVHRHVVMYKVGPWAGEGQATSLGDMSVDEAAALFELGPLHLVPPGSPPAADGERRYSGAEVNQMCNDALIAYYNYGSAVYAARKAAWMSKVRGGEPAPDAEAYPDAPPPWRWQARCQGCGEGSKADTQDRVHRWATAHAQLA